MKTILYILGGLFILSKLNGQGLNLTGTVTAAATPYGTTPPGGAAAVIAPAYDPYANLNNQGGVGGGAPSTPGQMSDKGYTFATFQGSPLGARSFNNAHVVGTGFKVA